MVGATNDLVPVTVTVAEAVPVTGPWRGGGGRRGRGGRWRTRSTEMQHRRERREITLRDGTLIRGNGAALGTVRDRQRGLLEIVRRLDRVSGRVVR